MKPSNRPLQSVEFLEDDADDFSHRTDSFFRKISVLAAQKLNFDSARADINVALTSFLFGIE
jgi:hypothetical protein